MLSAHAYETSSWYINQSPSIPPIVAESTSCVCRVLRRCATNAPRGPAQDAKRVLEVQAKQLNDEARHLRSLKQCIQVGAVD
jgi:hypothetical protein